MSKGNIVITGAGSGLGRSLARKYSELGYHICLLGRRKEMLAETAKTLENNYSIYTLDVSKKDQVVNVFASISDKDGPVDMLINNAGVGAFHLAEEITEDMIHQMIDINLKGTIFCTQEVVKVMKENNNGIIANIISTAGLEGKVTESVYCASKFGVRGFTEGLREEVKETPIKVYAAYMGGMSTDFWDGIYETEQTNRLMNPDDIADILMDNLKTRKGLQVTDIVIKNKF